MDEKNKPDEELFYMENGLIVFTAAYHLKRGYCCDSGCRHCPYDRKSDKSRASKQGSHDVDGPDKSNV